MTHELADHYDREILALAADGKVTLFTAAQLAAEVSLAQFKAGTVLNTVTLGDDPKPMTMRVCKDKFGLRFIEYVAADQRTRRIPAGEAEIETAYRNSQTAA